MNENLVCWGFFFVMFLWHNIMGCQCTQKCVYRIFGRLTWMVQAYTLTLLGLGLLQFRTAFDVLMFDVLKYKWLTSPIVEQDVRAIPGITEEEIASYSIAGWIRKASLSSPLFGTLAFLVVFIQVIYIGASRRKFKSEAEQWDSRLTVRDTCVLMVIGMPAVFIVMSNRATVRVLTIMSGSAWAGYVKSHPDGTRGDWMTLKTEEWGLYEMDLELAAAFQYVTVFGFGYLCAKCLDRHHVSESYRFALKYAGIQGVYAYVLVGLLRSFGNFGVAVAQSFAKEYVSVDKITTFQTEVLGKLSAVFTFTTLLCIYNMIIIGKMPEIQQAIPSCGMKFFATRFLLLVAQIQPAVLKNLQSDSNVILKLKSMERFQDSAVVQSWELSREQAWLLHSSLLSIYCLGIVIWNLVAWRNHKYVNDSFHPGAIHSDGSEPLGDHYSELPSSPP